MKVRLDHHPNYWVLDGFIRGGTTPRFMIYLGGGLVLGLLGGRV